MKFNKLELKQDLLGKKVAIFPSDKFKMGAYGTVTRINSNSTVNGDWGDLTLVPGEDVFELVGYPATIRDKYINIHK